MKVDLDEIESMLRSGLDCRHDVTLALIARIRELEIALGELVAECEERTENPDGDFYSEPRDLLEKGVVL